MVVTGQQLGAELAKFLGLPLNTIGFTLSCRINEVVTVECEYYPDIKMPLGEELARAIGRFELLRVADQQPERELQDFDEWMRKRKDAAHAEYMGRHAKGGWVRP